MTTVLENVKLLRKFGLDNKNDLIVAIVERGKKQEGNAAVKNVLKLMSKGFLMGKFNFQREKIYER